MVQNIFIKLWEKRAQAEKMMSIKSFLHYTAHNSLIDQLKKRI